MLNWVIGAIVLYLLYEWLNAKPKNFPPGPPTVPFLGSFPFIPSEHFHFYLEKAQKQYGNIIGFKFGAFPAIAVCGVDEVLEVFKHEDFQARPLAFAQLRPTEGLFFANGEHWKDQRRFTLRHLRDFGFGKQTMADLIHAEIQDFCDKIMKGKQTIEITGLFKTSSLNIIWTMISGNRLEYGNRDDEQIMDLLQRAFRQSSVNGGILFLPWLKNLISLFHKHPLDSADIQLEKLFNKVINEHLASVPDTPRDFLDVYLKELENPERKPSFNYNTLIEIMRDFFGAGLESSSNSVSFAIMYLLRHPEWQEKLIKEIDTVLEGSKPLYEDIARLPKVEAFLTEVQRCNTISPISVPRGTTKNVTFHGYDLPKDTLVHVSIWSVLQDEKHWGDPKNFRPERFLDDQGRFQRDPALVFFGAGARKCIGEVLARNFSFLVFILLLQRFKFTLPKGAPLPDTECVSGFTTAPKTFFADLEQR